MKTKPRLLATAGTVDGIAKLINEYFYSSTYTVNPDTLEISRPDSAVPDGYRVIRKTGRLRFEHV